MPRMRALSARADVGGIRFRDSERRSQGRDRNQGKPRLNLFAVRVLIEPSWFGRRTPSPLRCFVSPLSFGMLLSGFRAPRCYSSSLCKLNELFPGYFTPTLRTMPPSSRVSAAPTANTIEFWSPDRWNVSSLDCALVALSKTCRYPVLSKI